MFGDSPTLTCDKCGARIDSTDYFTVAPGSTLCYCLDCKAAAEPIGGSDLEHPIAMLPLSEEKLQLARLCLQRLRVGNAPSPGIIVYAALHELAQAVNMWMDHNELIVKRLHDDKCACADCRLFAALKDADTVLSNDSDPTLHDRLDRVTLRNRAVALRGAIEALLNHPAML